MAPPYDFEKSIKEAQLSDIKERLATFEIQRITLEFKELKRRTNYLYDWLMKRLRATSAANIGASTPD